MSAIDTTNVEQRLTVEHYGAPLRMSYEEYLAWEHEEGLTEWVDGEVIVHMPPKDEHQHIVEFLHQILSLFVQLFDLGKVRIAPFAMRVIPGATAREPDLFFLATENLHRLARKELEGPADLIVEVVSDDSVARDYDVKFAEYQAGGVREYWIIDPRPERLRANFYILDGKGRYQPVPIADDDIYRSTVLPGFWLKLGWLWMEKPNSLAALAEIVGADRIIAALRG